jgi:hypothetical protein
MILEGIFILKSLGLDKPEKSATFSQPSIRGMFLSGTVSV